MKKVTVVIVNYNGWKDTISCLESLGKSRVVIIDNASKDDSVINLKKWILEHKQIEVELKELSSNRGFSGGNNVGIRSALRNKSDYILLLNNDTVADGQLVTRLVERAADDKVGIVAPKIYFAKGYEYHKMRYKQNELGRVIWFAGGEIDWSNMYVLHRGVDEVDIGQYNTGGETDFITGCCMLIKREVIEQIGFLDDNLYLYLEDFDYCMRAKRAGYKLMYEPSGKLWHKNASSSDKPGSKLHQYYLTRNRLIVGMRYAPIRTKIALLRESLKFLQCGGVLRKAVWDYYFYNWGRWKN